MIRALFSVGLWTLLSRLTGFVRDILLARYLGAGLLMDAFAVAFRLPNHFRAIFGEGAFTSAFVPQLSRIREESGVKATLAFQGRMLSLMLVAQIALLALVLAFTPGFVRLLAPGFAASAETFRLAVDLTRITFPYLALITLVTLWTGVLNAEKRFVAGAAAPILLNLAMISCLIAGYAFTSYAHAAAWGVLIAGVLEAGLLAFAAHRAGLLALPRLPNLDEDTRRFLAAFVPAVIGAAGVQIAMLADTILVTFLPQGGASSLYYADRLYQLPVGVIGVAAGTVLLPEMSRLIAAGNEDEAHRQQMRALGVTLLVATPFLVAFLMLPKVLVGALFGYGAFGEAAIGETARVLQAYGIGLLAVVSIRSMIASFHARGDTTTPLIASLAGIGFNLGLKLMLWQSHGAAGLAFATACGAVLNLAILATLAIRQGKAAPDYTFAAFAMIAFAGGIWIAAGVRIVDLVAPGLAGAPALAALMVYGAGGGIAYLLIAALGMKLGGLSLRG
jgi:putative peptidoglycan lipid II flippase